MYNNSIGIIYQLSEILDNGTEKLTGLGIDCIQIQSWVPSLWTQENAEKVKKILEGKIRISSFWCGWTGPAIWNSIDGPVTLGLVPSAYRYQRMQELARGIDFASWLGVENVATHVGFVPENPCQPEYREIINAVKYVVEYCESKNIYFNFETGQETPVTLMRLITDIGKNNTGINLDPANLIMYGRGNPVDALDIFKGYIRGVHVKDADYTKDFYQLGHEKVVGEGSVNYPVFMAKLLKDGYTGDLYIEREIGGEQQIIDIMKTVIYIKGLME